MSQIPENRRSADQAYSHRRQCADNWRPSCSCAAKIIPRSLQLAFAELARRHDVPLRQSYRRVAKRAAIMVGRYTHAHQFKRPGARSSSCAFGSAA